jgi:hypothetical protein
VFHEIEARAAHTVVVQCLEFGIAKSVGDDADPLDPCRVVGDGVEHGAVVAAMAARLQHLGASSGV